MSIYKLWPELIGKVRMAGIPKDMTIGSGSYGYKARSAQAAYGVIGGILSELGLSVIPSVVSHTIERLEVASKQGGTRIEYKAVLTVSISVYAPDGSKFEAQTVAEGVDSADKACGKALTYAMKQWLLNATLAPLDGIDDTDNDHSDTHQQQAKPQKQADPAWEKVMAYATESGVDLKSEIEARRKNGTAKDFTPVAAMDWVREQIKQEFSPDRSADEDAAKYHGWEK